MNVEGDAGRIAEPQLRALYAYWLSKRGERRWPSGEDIRTDEVPALVPHIILVDVLQDGRFFRFRVLGRSTVHDVDVVGQLQHEALPAGIYRDHITALYRRAAAGPGALYSQAGYDYADHAELRGPRSVSRLFLPLAADGKVVDMMLVGQMHDHSNGTVLSALEANPPTVNEELEIRLP